MDTTKPLTIPGFRITGTIGAGGFGTVYRAVQTDLDRAVALKVLSESAISASGLRRFKREAKVLARMNHPHLLQLYAFDESVPWIATELLPGGTLRDRLRRADGTGRSLALADAVRLGRQLFDALATLHAAGLVHRDVKPANILYRENGDAVLGDLGLVRDLQPDVTRVTRHGEVMGTPAYLAPEIFAGTELGVSSDLFAAGVVLYEALTGRHPSGLRPFVGPLKIDPPAALRPEIPAALSELVMELISVEPGRRPASASAALERLSRPRAAASGTARVRRRASPAVLGGVALVLVVAVALVMLFPSRPHPWPLQVDAQPRQVSVRVRHADPGLVLCVYDAAGKVHQCVDGTASGGETRFAVDRLAPGAAYRAQVLAPAGSGSAPRGEVAFRTPLEVGLLGVDGEDPPGVWLRVTPACVARWAGQPGTHRAGARYARMPLPPGNTAELELTTEWGETARLALTLPPRRPVERTLPLGVVVADLRATLARPGVSPQSVVDFLVGLRPRYAVVSPNGEGGPNLAPELAAELWRRARIGTIYQVRTEKPPGLTPWTAALSALDAGAPGQFAVGIPPEWLGGALKRDDAQQVLDNTAAWRSFLSKRQPPLSMVVPFPSEAATRAALGPVPRSWAPALGPVDALDGPSGEDGPVWYDLWDKVVPRLKAAGLPVALTSNWIMRERRRTLGFDFPVERRLLANVFLRMLARNPATTVVFDTTDGPSRELGPAFDELVRVARRVAGLGQVANLTTARAPPRLEAHAGTSGFSFGNGPRVQVAFTRRPATVAFWPARPGTLSLDGAPPTLVTTARVELPLTDRAAIYEELAPVEAAPRGGVPVSITFTEP